MDTTRFDRIAKMVSAAPSRREVLRLLGLATFGAVGLSLLGAAETEAKQRHKRRKRRKHKKKNKGPKCKGRCGGNCPRCAVGSPCDDCGACTTALCVANVCKEPTSDAECGLDPLHNPCIQQENFETGESFCSGERCRNIHDGVVTCADCDVAQERCVRVGDEFECCPYCGISDLTPPED